MSTHYHIGAHYLLRGTLDHSTVVEEAVIKLNGPRIRKRYDTLVGTGISGALVVPTLGYLLKKDFILVRKPDDKSTHSAHRLEGTTKDGANVLFIDDFWCSGDTLKRVSAELVDLHCGLNIIGEYYYGGSGRNNGGIGQSLEWYK